MSTPVVPDPATEPFITVARAATILGLHQRSIYLAIDRGEIPTVRIGRALRIPTAKFLAQYSADAA